MRKINWTNIGKEEGLSKTPQQRKRILNAAIAAEWESVKGEKPMAPGMAISESIKQFRIPNVKEIAISNDLAPFGFYGIRGHYKDGIVELFIIDRGSDIVPVVSFFTEEKAQ